MAAYLSKSTEQDKKISPALGLHEYAEASHGDAGDAVVKGSSLEYFEEAEEIVGLINSIPNVAGDLIPMEMALERFTFIVDKYQEQPHLIDPHLESILEQLLKMARDTTHPPKVMHLAFKFLYLVTKMRGYKVIVRQLPHEVADLEPVLEMLTNQNPEDHETWETRYILLLWLSIIVLIPFDMSRLDSNIRMESGEYRKPIMDRILDVAKIYIGVFDTAREAAAFLISKFLTRPDVQKQHLPAFLDWALVTLTQANPTNVRAMDKMNGILQTLSLLFKHGKREDLLTFAPVVLKTLVSLKMETSKNTLLRKLAIKLVQRIGLTFLKTRLASWRYQRGSRSLAENLQVGGQGPVAKETVAMKDEEDEDDYDVPDEIEEVIEQVLRGLKDRDTIVRWSAAKGVGRVTCRLPRELADQVVEEVLDCFSLQEADEAWHGGCLALAELGRRGLLLPSRLPKVVPVMLKALTYSEKRAAYSVGSHVRDAACYVCWAFARAYEPEEIKPYVQQIASALIITAVADREVNCRRAASAAFQENVGRQGTFPHGIDIVTTVDYFAVGSRNNCYLNLSVYVAQFEEYTQALVDHLVQHKISHWDPSLRSLTSEALHNLTPKCPDYMAKTILPMLLPLCTGMDLATRYGAILSSGQIVHALYKLGLEKNQTITDIVDRDVLEGLANVPGKLEAAQLYRGIGADYMRPAACSLIEKMSLSKVPLVGSATISVWQTTIDDTMKLMLAGYQFAIQDSAIAGFAALCNEYYRTEEGTALPDIQDKVIDSYLGQLQNEMVYARCCFILALGALPKFMIAGKLKKLLSGLIGATKVTVKDISMAEARRDAIKSIISICSTVGIEKGGSPDNVICEDNINSVYDTFLQAMEDYTTDRRGDVGTWVREAAVVGLAEITSQALQVDASLIQQEYYEKTIFSVLHQAGEKIDRARVVAGETLLRLLYHDPPVPYIPHREELLNLFPEKDKETLNWASAAECYPKLMPVLSLKSYTYPVLLGLTVSVGGLTESLVKHSSHSLNSYMLKIADDEDGLTAISDTLLTIFNNYLKVDRVSLPLLKMLDFLLGSGCFELFTQQEDHPFTLALVDLCKKEIAKCGDPQKLLATIGVFCQLVQFSGTVRERVLFQLLVLLGHKYPKVRKSTANQLYEMLITYEDIVAEENLDEVMTILSETTWDDDSLEGIRVIRNQLCDLMGVKKPVSKAPAKPKQEKAGDDRMSSYADLVGRLGY
ncbi:tubulin-specific chaperone D-like [Branchiostoma floridae x Branchiostoma japonicum]